MSAASMVAVAVVPSISAVYFLPFTIMLTVPVALGETVTVTVVVWPYNISKASALISGVALITSNFAEPALKV